MIELDNRTILDDGTVICTVDAAIEMMYQGLDIEHAIMEPSDEVATYNRAVQMMDTGQALLETATEGRYQGVDWYSMWLTPEPYTSVDVLDYCLMKCDSVEEIKRVQYEMQLFEDRNMMQVLRHLIYMVDNFRSRNVLWGVGRGSSVSSFVLHLIGINRINPLKFGLDVREFLK